ncbi:carbonyl reductase family member 4 [Jimgerdemannia flammicorona]|uniref:Carbonyl reductase family member 4 n=1 Tax=Jimgerdemannia flammicorona TaxID=994334 RepID=A0A433QYJ8_9FUNG|nr:carbonyl reductase family member 4 [Jimgerdemannia flammicorona]
MGLVQPSHTPTSISLHFSGTMLLQTRTALRITHRLVSLPCTPPSKRYNSNLANPFTSQVAVVTGGTRGIGLAIAERFVNHGATIIVLSRDSSRVASAVERLEAIDADGTFRTHKGYVCDVGEGMEVEQVFKDITASTQIDYLINAAGISRDDLLIQLKPNDLHETLRTNLMGTIHTCRAAAKAMLRRRKGVIRIRNFLIPVQRRHCCIINLSSVVGIQGHVGQTIYSATKAGVIGFSKSLSKELGSRNVRVNVLAPGFIQTDMTSGIPDDKRAAWLKRITMSRFGTPDEVAHAAVFLATAEYITGQVLVVDGGLNL